MDAPRACTIADRRVCDGANAGARLRCGIHYGIDLHGDGGSFSDLDNENGVAGPVFRSPPPY